MKDKIRYINIAVTNRCNLKCNYCDIWREGNKKEIDAKLIGKMLTSPVLSKRADITLTGGEPFLYRSLDRLARIILCGKPGSLKTISTNGTLFSAMKNFLSKFSEILPKGFALNVSLDRRSRHSPSMLTKNMLKLKKLFPLLELRTKFTITPSNYKELLPAYFRAKEYGFAFRMKIIEQAAAYTNKLSCDKVNFGIFEKKLISRDLLLIKANLGAKDINLKNFIDRTISVLWDKKIKGHCSVLDNRIFIMPDGTVYSCLHAKNLGNLYARNLEDIWLAPEALKARKDMMRLGCKGCAAYHGYP